MTKPLEKPYLYSEASNWVDFIDNKKTYVIPANQRPYSWTGDQIDLFCNDIENEESLFIGTIMMRKQEDENIFEIVDDNKDF